MNVLEGAGECWSGLLWEVSLFLGSGGGDRGEDCCPADYVNGGAVRLCGPKKEGRAVARE